MKLYKQYISAAHHKADASSIKSRGLISGLGMGYNCSDMKLAYDQPEFIGEFGWNYSGFQFFNVIRF